MATHRPPPPPASGLAAAMGLLQAGRVDEARRLCEQLAREQPRAPEPRQFLGMIAARTGDFAAAERWLAESLALQPDHPGILNNRAVALRKLGRDAEAIDDLRRAVALNPDYAEAQFNLGNALRDARAFEEALVHYTRAAALRPDHAAAWNAQAGVLLALERAAPAQAAAERALALQADDADALVNLGAALAQLKRPAQALDCFGRALATQPHHAGALANRGGLLLELNRAEEAIADLDRALALAPGRPETYEARADAATRARRHDEAAQFYERLHAIAPAHPFALGNLLHARMLAADWRDFDPLRDAIQAALRRGEPAAEPFGYQGIAESEADLRTCAALYAAREYPPLAVAPPPLHAGDRITVGYLCGEFRRHATTLLMIGVFEQHRRSRFRLVAFDNGDADDSDERRRFEAAFDERIDIRALDDDAAAARVRAAGVDILVNLNGYYGAHRMGVFARRAAPLQVNYLGFPGTLGAGYIDYLIADATVLPPSSREHCVEQLVHLPHSYQANDQRRARAADPGTRAGHGLPSDAFVFFCFNNSYKITPPTFDRWMRILGQVPGSVLWLLDDKAGVADRLRAQAQARGIDPARLVFAPFRPSEEHLARHTLADLGLDTLPYNAHTTASDALWAGVPFVTQRGTTFPGRVGASLLQAAGLPELIAEDGAAFEALAVALAHDRPRLAALRDRVAAARATCPLFDTQRFTRHLEAAYEAMVARARAGLPPDFIAIPDAASGA